MTRNQEKLKEFFAKELQEKRLVRFLGSVELLSPRTVRKLVNHYFGENRGRR